MARPARSGRGSAQRQGRAAVNPDPPGGAPPAAGADFDADVEAACAVDLVEVGVFRWRPAGTRQLPVTRTVTGEVTAGAVRDPVPATGTDLPTGGTAIDGAAAMTLVQVKRPDRRLDTAEVIPTVTREVDAEGVRKAYRGDDAPTKEKDLVRRQEDLAGRKSGRRRRDHRACGMAPGARQRRSSCSGRCRPSRPETLARDWSRPLDKEAMTLRKDCPDFLSGRRRQRSASFTCAWGIVSGRRRSKARGQEAGRAPSVRGRGAATVLGLDSADGRVAAHRPTPDVPAHGTTHRRYPLGGGPEGCAARPGLTPPRCPEETRPDLRQSETADESACTPGSVTRSPRGGRGDGHPSRTGIAAGLMRSTRELGRAALERSRRTVLRRPLLTLLRVGFT